MRPARSLIPMDAIFQAKYQEYVASIEGEDPKILYMRFLGELCELKTITASKFERKSFLQNESKWSEATSWIKFVEHIQHDWETRDKIDPIQTLVAIAPKCFGSSTQIIVSQQHVDNLREFKVFAHSSFLAHIVMETEVGKHDFNKYCQLEIIRHVQPIFFKLLLACAVKRFKLADNESFVDNFYQTFDEVRPKLCDDIEEKFKVKFLKVAVPKPAFQQTQHFNQVLKDAAYVDERTKITKYFGNLSGSGAIDLWGACVHRFMSPGLEKQQVNSKQQNLKCIKIWFSKIAEKSQGSG